MAEGSRVGRYRVDAVIARGGMGIVYRATDPALERSVALKVIAPELARDEEFRARFVRESRLAAALDHPNVIPVYEAGDEDGALFIAMRFVEGRDLRDSSTWRAASTPSARSGSSRRSRAPWTPPTLGGSCTAT